MRGRTNITQRALPYVNGDVITAEVETGNTISVGDFVEYKTASGISKADFQANGEIYYNHTTYMTNYLLVLNYTNTPSLEIWDKRTTKIVTKISFANIQYMSFDVLNDNNIVLCTHSTSNRGRELVVYIIAFENNQLIIKNQKTFDIWVNFWNSTPVIGSVVAIMSGVCQLDNSHIMIMTNNNSQDRQWFVTVIDYSNETVGNIVTSTQIKSGSDYTINAAYNHFIIKLDDKKVGFVIAGGYAYYGIIDFDNSYAPTISSITKDANFVTSAVKSKINAATICCITSMYVGSILYYNSTNDSFEKYTFNPGLSFTLLSYATHGNDNIVFISDVNNGGSGPNKNLNVCRVEFIESTKEIKSTVLELIRNISFYGNYGMKIYFPSSNGERVKGYSLNDDSYSMENAEYNLIYSPSDNVLSKGVDTNYVKSYNGGKAIGFAKTAGNAGENIRIYVPHQS